MTPEALTQMEQDLKNAFTDAVSMMHNYSGAAEARAEAASAVARLATARLAVHNAKQAEQKAAQPQQATEPTLTRSNVRREVDGHGGYGNRG